MIERRNNLPAEYVRSLLAYDPATGVFRWKVYRANRRMKPGDIAGSPNSAGYVAIYIDGVPYKAHRLAVLIVTGAWPTHDVDHRDLDKSNNRWGNLRQATVQQNAHNKALRKDSTSGVRGVSYHKRERKWQAYITDPATRRRRYLGEFKNFDDAAAARTAAEVELFGEFRYEEAS